jgi:hypothetical protein
MAIDPMDFWGSFPKGTILPFAGDLTHVPNGWEVCDGITVRSTSWIEFLLVQNQSGRRERKLDQPTILMSFLDKPRRKRTSVQRLKIRTPAEEYR